MKVKLDYSTIENFTQHDFDLAQKAVTDFKPLAEVYRNFYTTIFLNKENRKINIKIISGKLKSVSIEKIDDNEA